MNINRAGLLPIITASLLVISSVAWSAPKGADNKKSSKYIANEIRAAWSDSDDAGLARRADFVADKIILFRVPLSQNPNENALVDSVIWADAWRSEAGILRRYRPGIHQTNITVKALNDYEVVESGISRWPTDDGREASSEWEIKSTVSDGKIIVVRGIVKPTEYRKLRN